MNSNWWGRRGLIAGVVLGAMALLGSMVAGAAPTSEQAQDLVQGVGNDVIEILADEELASEEKLASLIDLLEGPIDIDLVARLILGRHWRTATPEQRQEYLDLFREYALDSIASKLNLYEGQSFDVTSARVLNERDALVTTQIISGGRPPLKVDWRLREIDGSLVAIDVIVENVSMIVTQRSEFSSVVERQGMDGLLAELRSRIDSRQPA
jgi:phospholipid transport system substrate-binding protein